MTLTYPVLNRVALRAVRRHGRGQSAGARRVARRRPQHSRRSQSPASACARHGRCRRRGQRDVTDGDVDGVSAQPGYRDALHQHDPHADDRRRAGGELRATPARRWRSRRSRTCCGTASCASIRPIRSGRTATASCSPTATRRCCCGRSCISPACKAVNPEYEVLGRPSVTLDDIKHFRQFGSHAPGHPEYHLVSGVETTTGPLGQGIATSVGMAIAQKWLATRYNQPDFTIFDYDIYATCGDGCLMEGVGAEAASLAGPPRARQSLLDLRQQSHHHRRQHAHRVHRGRRGAVPGLPVERAARRRRQRPRAHRARAHTSSS